MIHKAEAKLQKVSSLDLPKEEYEEEDEKKEKEIEADE